MNSKLTIDELADKYPEFDMLKMDGFDECAICVMWTYGREQPVIAYDREKVIKQLMNDGMSYDDSNEYHEFNQSGAYMGPGTPCFIETCSK